MMKRYYGCDNSPCMERVWLAPRLEGGRWYPRWRSPLPTIELGSRFHSPSLKGHKLAELPGSPASNMFKWIGTFRNFPDPKTEYFLWIPRINQLALSFWCSLILAWVSRTSTTSGKTNPTCFNWVLKKNTTIRSETFTRWWKTHGRCLARSDRRVMFFFWRRLGSPLNLKQNDEGDVLGDDFVESYYVIHSRWEWDAWQGFFFVASLGLSLGSFTWWTMLHRSRAKLDPSLAGFLLRQVRVLSTLRCFGTSWFWFHRWSCRHPGANQFMWIMIMFFWMISFVSYSWGVRTTSFFIKNQEVHVLWQSLLA